MPIESSINDVFRFVEPRPKRPVEITESIPLLNDTRLAEAIVSSPPSHGGEGSSMHKARHTLEGLLHSFPEERESLRPYVDRAKAYSNECGCSMGGAFLLGSLGLLILYCFLFNGFGRGNLLTDALWGTAFVFSAGIVGKLTGIGIARIRLALLYRHLVVKYQMKGG